MLYVESSALVKRYITERDSDIAIRFMDAEPLLFTSRLTEIEVRRNLARLIGGRDLLTKRQEFQDDLAAFEIVELDDTAFDDAGRIAEDTLCRSLDALHLAAARRASPSATVLTFDQRQARAARAIGLAVIGA
ncbi:type II toxin-antitoxin system VapC family toxin [Candidatus Poriferisodalis sp.]|uniref:type II toxin-antitoxin system VapC family toxin n=1 Tax=Candidatus Poriferisodalis sp. TaxID=3101277 RepID=UPI003C6F85CD